MKKGDSPPPTQLLAIIVDTEVKKIVYINPESKNNSVIQNFLSYLSNNNLLLDEVPLSFILDVWDNVGISFEDSMKNIMSISETLTDEGDSF